MDESFHTEETQGDGDGKYPIPWNYDHYHYKWLPFQNPGLQSNQIGSDYPPVLHPQSILPTGAAGNYTSPLNKYTEPVFMPPQRMPYPQMELPQIFSPINADSTPLQGLVPVPPKTDPSPELYPVNYSQHKIDCNENIEIREARHIQSFEPQQATGRRRRRPSGDMPEDEKKAYRRYKNKVAAQRCRQRKIDHLNRVIKAAEDLEERLMENQKIIDFLQKDNNRLRELLKYHRPCLKGVSNNKILPNYQNSQPGMRKNATGIKFPTKLQELDGTTGESSTTETKMNMKNDNEEVTLTAKTLIKKENITHSKDAKDISP